LDQKDLPVKSTEDLLIGTRKPIVFHLYGYKDQQVVRNLLTPLQPVEKAIVENAQTVFKT
jgi:GTPase